MSILSLIQILKTAFTFVKKHVKLILLAIVIALGYWVYSSQQTIAKKNTEIAQATSNVTSYQNIVSGYKEKNNTLTLSISALKTANDSLLTEIKKVAQNEDVDLSDTSTAVSIASTIHDTIPAVLKDSDFVDSTKVNFRKKIQYNEETSFEIIRQDTILSVIPTITNKSVILVYTDKTYKYSNFFSRLVHLNFKRVSTTKYILNNSNKIFTTTDMRVVQIKQ